MRFLNGGLAALLALFAAVQWNDPDGPLWMAIYGAAALWCAVAAFRPALLGRPVARALFAGSMIAALAGTVFYWPHEHAWWTIEVWWNAETAREGMGMMIVVLCLLAVAMGGRGSVRAGTANA